MAEEKDTSVKDNGGPYPGEGPKYHIAIYTAIYIPTQKLLIFGGTYYDQTCSRQFPILYGGKFEGLEDSIPSMQTSVIPLSSFHSDWRNFLKTAQIVGFGTGSLSGTGGSCSRVEIYPDTYQYKVFGLHYVNDVILFVIQNGDDKHICCVESPTTANLADLNYIISPYSVPQGGRYGPAHRLDSSYGTPFGIHSFACHAGGLIDGVWHDDVISTALLCWATNDSTISTKIIFCLLGSPKGNSVDSVYFENRISFKIESIDYSYCGDHITVHTNSSETSPIKKYFVMNRDYNKDYQISYRIYYMNWATVYSASVICMHSQTVFLKHSATNTSNRSMLESIDAHSINSVLLFGGLIKSRYTHYSNELLDYEELAIFTSTQMLGDIPSNSSGGFKKGTTTSIYRRNMYATLEDKASSPLKEIQPYYGIGFLRRFLPIYIYDDCIESNISADNPGKCYQISSFAMITVPSTTTSKITQPIAIMGPTETKKAAPSTTTLFTNFQIPDNSEVLLFTQLSDLGYRSIPVRYNPYNHISTTPCQHRYSVIDSLPIKQKDGKYKFIYYGMGEGPTSTSDAENYWRPLIGLMYYYDYYNDSPTPPVFHSVSLIPSETPGELLDVIDPSKVTNPGIDKSAKMTRIIVKPISSDNSGKIDSFRLEHCSPDECESSLSSNEAILSSEVNNQISR